MARVSRLFIPASEAAAAAEVTYSITADASNTADSSALASVSFSASVDFATTSALVSAALNNNRISAMFFQQPWQPVAIGE